MTKRTYETTKEQEDALTKVRERANKERPEDQQYADNQAYWLARNDDFLNSYVEQEKSPDQIIAEKDARIAELEAQLKIDA